MEQTSYQTENVNCAPQSKVRRAGTPNLDTHVEINARAEALEVMENSGTASGHLEDLSIIVKSNCTPGRKARAPPDPGGRERISYQGLEYWVLETSCETGSYSADSRDKILSRGQHPWPDQATQTWKKHVLQGGRDHERAWNS